MRDCGSIQCRFISQFNVGLCLISVGYCVSIQCKIVSQFIAGLCFNSMPKCVSIECGSVSYSNRVLCSNSTRDCGSFHDGIVLQCNVGLCLIQVGYCASFRAIVSYFTWVLATSSCGRVDGAARKLDLFGTTKREVKILSRRMSLCCYEKLQEGSAC